MGKKLDKSKTDTIEEIENILLQETETLSEKPHKKTIAPEPEANKTHRPTKHAILKSALISLAIIIIPAVFAIRYVSSIEIFLRGIARKDDETSEEQPEEEKKEEKLTFGDKPVVFYISGSDSRTSVHDETARSDVNIIAVVNPTTSKILLVSTPRDYYVQLHGTTGLRDKLTHAGIYGINMSKQTLEDLLDVKVDTTVKVGFDALKSIVDAIGGIDIYSDQDLSLSSGKCRFTGGTTQHVDGTCALAFSRERKSYVTGDRHRGQNQQQVIAKIVEKVSSPAYLLKLPEILRAADGLFETSLTYQEILDIIRFQLWNGISWTTESVNLDGTGSMQPTYSIPGQSLYVMIPSDASIASAKEKITNSLKTKAELEEEERVRQEAEAKAQQEVDEQANL